VQIDDQAAQTLNTAMWTGSLEPGTHRIQAWAPLRQLWDTVVTLQGTAPQRIIAKLRFSQLYYEQARLDSVYDKARVSNTINTTAVLAVNAGLIWYVGFQGIGNRNKYVSNVQSAAIMYQNSILKSDIELAKESYNYYKDLHERHRAYNKWKFIIGGPVIATTLYFGYKILKKQRRPKKVILKDPNPLAGVQWRVRPDIGLTGPSYHGFTLTLQW
jgi:hypothetical protein